MSGVCASIAFLAETGKAQVSSLIVVSFLVWVELTVGILRVPYFLEWKLVLYQRPLLQ